MLHTDAIAFNEITDFLARVQIILLKQLSDDISNIILKLLIASFLYFENDYRYNKLL